MPEVSGDPVDEPIVVAVDIAAFVHYEQLVSVVDESEQLVALLDVVIDLVALALGQTKLLVVFGLAIELFDSDIVAVHTLFFPTQG